MKLYLLLALVLAPTMLISMQSKQTTKVVEKYALAQAALTALRNGDPVILKLYMRDKDFDINYLYEETSNLDGSKYFKTLLSYAVRLGNDLTKKVMLPQFQDCLHMLLKHPGVRSIADAYGMTPLHEAVFNDNPTALRILLEYADKIDLDLNKQDKTGDTALSIAAAGIKSQHVKLLLSMPSINPNIANDHGLYPLHMSDNGLTNGGYEITQLDELTIMRDLVERGADIECTGKIKEIAGFAALGRPDRTESPLWVAFKEARPDLRWGSLIRPIRLTVLLALGAKVQPTEHIDELMHLARTELRSAKGNIHEDDFLRASFSDAIKGTLQWILSTVEYLKDKAKVKDLVNVQDERLGMTPLMWAAARGNLPLAKQLILMDADPLKTDIYGDTALHYAIRNGHAEMVTYLTQKAPDAFTMKNKNKRTPTDIAIAADKSLDLLAALSKGIKNT